MLSLRVLRTKTSVIPRNIRTISSTSALRNDAFHKRETAFETKDVKKHDQELIKQLRESELARQKAEKKAEMAEKRANASGRSVEEDFDTSFEGTKKNVSMKEFLDFQKQMIRKLRDLEDEIHDLKSKGY